MAFDLRRGAIVLFGGLNVSAPQQGGAAPAPLGDTWEHLSTAGGSLSLVDFRADTTTLQVNQQVLVTATLSGPAVTHTPPVTIAVSPGQTMAIDGRGPLPQDVNFLVGSPSVTVRMIALAVPATGVAVLTASFGETSLTISFTIS